MPEKIIGYARDIYGDVDLAKQIADLRAAGCAAVYTDDALDAADAKRPGLEQAIAAIQPGDFLMVMGAECLASTLEEYGEILFRLRERGCQILVADGDDDRCNAILSRSRSRPAPLN